MLDGSSLTKSDDAMVVAYLLLLKSGLLSDLVNSMDGNFSRPTRYPIRPGRIRRVLFISIKTCSGYGFKKKKKNIRNRFGPDMNNDMFRSESKAI